MAHLKFALQGHNSSEPKRVIDGIIDTGFSGSVQVPRNVAEELDLPEPFATMGVKLADGSETTNALTMACATLGDETKLIAVQVSPNGEILVGMDFLRIFNKALLASPSSGVLLMPDTQPEP